MKQLKTYIMKFFNKSNKKHLLITGSKKSGKTTILKEILKDKYSYGGIITYVVRDDKIPPKYVVLEDINDSTNKGIVAVRNKKATALIPNIQTFETLGVNIFNKYIHSDVKLIVVDEVGFLENDAKEYQKKILEVLDKKTAFLVLRKDSIPFIEEIINRDDVCLFDIDNIKKSLKLHQEIV